MADAKDTKWQVYRPEGYNKRILETYISSPVIDKQNDKIGTNTIKESMDFYMKYGVYSYKHEEMPVGLPLAYKIKEGKVKLRVGVHNRLPMHDRVWEEMQIYGDKGGSSIRGEAEKQEKVCEGDVCHNNISELSLWSVSWVGNRPANPEATVTQVATAKELEPIKLTKQVTLDEVEEMVEKIIERKGKKYCLFAKKDRKLLGCHKTRAGAVAQERAIQARRFSKMNNALDEMLFKIRLKNIDKLMWDIAGIKKCAVKNGIAISKAPRTSRTGRGMRGFMAACVANARQKLRNYDGLQNVKNHRAFCAELWRDPGSFPGRGPKMSPSRVRDQSGRAFQNAMSRAGWKPSERLRRGKTPSWNKK